MDRLLLLAALAALACGSASAPPNPPSRPDRPDPASLVVPAPATAERTLEQLDDLADADLQAAWWRAHYLLDLFDDARFRGDDASLRLLAAALEIPPARGPEATDRFADALLVEIDRVLGQQRLHRGAGDARTLVSFDRNPPSADGFADYAQSLRRISDSDSPVAGNAALRLAGRCERSFRDATAAAASQRWQRLRFCAWTLYGVDPASYGSLASMIQWKWLASDLLERWRHIADSSPRLAAAARTRLAILPTWFERNAAALPGHPRLDQVAVVDRALPWAWMPSFTSPSQAKAARLDLAVRGDGRATAAWVAPASSTASQLRAAAEVARASGAVRLQLVVKTAPATALPELVARHAGRKAMRPATLNLYLADARMAGPAAGVPRGQRWNPELWQAGLSIAVDRESWTVAVEGGALDSGPLGQLDRLGVAIDRVLSAYPDARAAVLVPSPGATVGAVARVLAASRFRSSGATRLAQLALAAPLSPSQRDLRPVIARRAAARVTIVPDSLAHRVPLIRRCYQDVLERNRRARAQFTVELRGTATYVVSGPKRGLLWSCAVPAVSDPMVAKRIERVTIKLAPSGPAGSR